MTDRVDGVLAQLLGVAHIEHGLAGADRVVAFTHALGQWYVDHGVPAERIGVVPCFPSKMPTGAVAQAVPGRIGFVAGDFRAKGGDTVLPRFGGSGRSGPRPTCGSPVERRRPPSRGRPSRG